MRTLSELLTTPGGVRLLAERGVTTDPTEFVERLEPPQRPGLRDLIGVGGERPLVYIGQQVCTDLLPATATKFSVLAALTESCDITPVLLWHDMDSVRSERFGDRVVLSGSKRQRGVRLVSDKVGDTEPRFVSVSPSDTSAAIAEVAEWTRTVTGGDRGSRARLERLYSAVADATTLAAVTRAWADVLVRDELGLDAPSTTASTMIANGLLVDSVEDYLSRLQDVVTVFNEAVDDLVRRDVDPAVRRLEPDYLPLRYSCPHDGTRLILRRERHGTDNYACATCRCDAQYSFCLGGTRASLESLKETGRWSIDVSMPVHHNDIASGWVAGRSTALYALVFNEVLDRVLGQKPIPILVPTSMGDQDANQTILMRYLLGSQIPTESTS